MCREKEGAAWSIPLEAPGLLPFEPQVKPDLPPTGKAASPSETARSLAFYPVIVGNQVVVADASRVIAVDVTTGIRRTWDLAEDLDQKLSQIGVQQTLPSGPGTCVTPSRSRALGSMPGWECRTWGLAGRAAR